MFAIESVRASRRVPPKFGHFQWPLGGMRRRVRRLASGQSDDGDSRAPEEQQRWHRRAEQAQRRRRLQRRRHVERQRSAGRTASRPLEARETAHMTHSRQPFCCAAAAAAAMTLNDGRRPPQMARNQSTCIIQQSVVTIMTATMIIMTIG